MIRIGIIGCGVIGQRRAEALPADLGRVTACFDPNASQAQALAQKFNGARVVPQLTQLWPEVDAVIVAAINSELVSLCREALAQGKHVIVEKPAARHFAELETLRPYLKAGQVFRVGFNHRYHPAFARIRQELAAHPDDPIMYVRASYGNGARVGFDKEWRAQMPIAGGGELLDQGVHVIDLASLILAPLKVTGAWCQTHYWDMPVDDNAWGLLTSEKAQTFSFHVSSSEWKNEFRFEVYTRGHKYLWQGLGRSYGVERLTTYRMKKEMGPPEVLEEVFSGEDNSWRQENEAFLADILAERSSPADFEQALKVLKIVEDVYRCSQAAQSGKGPQWWKP